MKLNAITATITGMAGSISHGSDATVRAFDAALSSTPQLDRRRLQTQPQEAQRGLTDDHEGDRQRGGGDHMAGEVGHHVAQDDGQITRAGKARGGDEVLLAHGQEPPAYNSRELGPAIERDDDGDCEVSLLDRKGLWERGRQPDPERDRWDGAEDLDDPLDHRIDRSAVVSGRAADQDAQHQAEGHADQTDGQRQACAVHDARVDVAPLLVGAEQERCHPPLVALYDQKVFGARKQTQQPILVTVANQPYAQPRFRVGLIHLAERLQIAFADQVVHMHAQRPVVEEAQALRRYGRELLVGFRGTGTG